jgi:pimeloyl-ACP methyl ester carboxylesterase
MQIRRVRVDGPDGNYHLSFTDWGAPNAARTVVCVHGLTRNGRDFDFLAKSLSAEVRVICPDMVGRGRSDRLADPAHYDVPTYAAHVIQLIDRLGLGQVDWIGSSMGGLVGMSVAAADARVVRRLVLNDIGPFVPKTALERIKRYLALDLPFASLAGSRHIFASFMPVSARSPMRSGSTWRSIAPFPARMRRGGCTTTSG